jgi:hypothetical protein
MFLKNTLTFFLVCSLFLPLTTKAQTFQRATHLKGTKTIAGVEVTVVPIALPDSVALNSCGTGPYHVGKNHKLNGFLYKFKSALTPAINVTTVRMQLTNVNYDELVSFYVNGHFFPVQQSDLSTFLGTCPVPLSEAINGKVGLNPPVTNSSASLTITSLVPIDSIYVYCEETGINGGVHYTFEFQSDPRVSIVPLVDTVLCLGDKMIIPFTTTSAFNGDNAFNAELSDENGNFDNPIVIGTTFSAGPGSISATIPDNSVKGTAYRVRIRSTSPIRTTADNGKNLAIYPYPTINISANSPLCVGDKLLLLAVADEGSVFTWQGPAGFTAGTANPSIEPMTEAYTGDFTVKADLFGCVSKDTVHVSIKPTPDVTGATNNGPICEGETLTISAKSNWPDATLTWNGPSLNTTEGKTVTINPAKATNKGIYKVYSTLNGCKSSAITTDADVKPLPSKPYAQNNGPLRVGDEIHLSGGTTTEGVTYLWTGPDGFTATQADTSGGVAYDRPDNEYKLTITLNGCSLSASTSITVVPEQLQQIYPNPTDGVLNIKLNLAKNDSKKIPIAIINHVGQVVQREEGETIFGSMRKTITLHPGLIPGMYLLRMSIDKKTTDIKFFYNGK